MGTAAGVLAAGNVTTKAARRRPNRAVEVGSRRMQTSVTRGTGQRLEATTDYGALRARLAARAPEALSPRVRAWRVVVLMWGSVLAAGYDPGARTVWGLLADDEGEQVMVSAEWLPEAPGGPGLLARALVEGADFVTGEASLRRGQLWLEPLLIGFGDTPMTLDLSEDVELPDLPTAAVPDPESALAGLVGAARGWLGETCRRGVRHLTEAQLAQGRTHATRLAEAGLLDLGRALEAVTQAETDRLDAWNRASARAEMLAHVLARTA